MAPDPLRVGLSMLNLDDSTIAQHQKHAVLVVGERLFKSHEVAMFKIASLVIEQTIPTIATDKSTYGESTTSTPQG